MRPQRYCGFKVDQFIKLKNPVTSDGITYPPGTLLKIVSFPEKVTTGNQFDGRWIKARMTKSWSLYTRFIHAIDEKGKSVRPFISEVIKTKESWNP